MSTTTRQPITSARAAALGRTIDTLTGGDPGPLIARLMRESRGMTQRELAARAEWASPFVCRRVEAGESRLTRQRADDIARATDHPVSMLDPYVDDVTVS